MASIDTICSRLERSRKDLLDLSGRNRLISTPRGTSRTRSVEIIDELSAEVFRLLVREGKSLSFIPGKDAFIDDVEGDGGDAPSLLYQPDDDVLAENGLAQRHVDAQLQTGLTSESLQKRLLNVFHDARTFEEEQGVSILYLAMGFLKWYEAPSSDRARYAPLLLIPVELGRQSAGSRFKLKLREEEIATNLSLQAKLDGEFGVRLPDVPELEELSPMVYFGAVAKAIESQPRWEVLPNDMVLWFFSFAKFLMYRDLRPENWPDESALAKHPLIASLLEVGFSSEPPICGDDDKIDPLIPPRDLVHVVDADSSQAVAIEEVRRGRNLVIQGPPGTGKSQTIANLIAAAVKENKRVLFVAEKMAALDVVKRRLEKVDLGEMCLELHSNKANKRVVLEDLAKTLRLGYPKPQIGKELIEDLTMLRDKLNGHVDALHRPLPKSCLSPFQILGHLVELRAKGVAPADFEVIGASDWTPQQRLESVNLLRDVSLHMQGVGVPAHHPWRGVSVGAIMPMDVERLKTRIDAVIQRLDHLAVGTNALARELHAKTGDSVVDVATLARLGHRLSSAPDMDRASIAHDVWQTRRAAISKLLQAGQTFFTQQLKLTGILVESAWTVEVRQVRHHLAAHGHSWIRWFNKDYREAQATLRGLLVVKPPGPLTERLGILDSLIEGQSARWSIDVAEDNDQLGRLAFGAKWQGVESDWAALEAIDRWESECRDIKLPNVFRQVMARMGDSAAIKRLLPQIAADMKTALQEAELIFQGLGLNLQVAFGYGNLHAVPLDDLKMRFQAWQASPESLTKWILFRSRWEKLATRGMAGLAAKMYDGSVKWEQAEDILLMAYFEQIMRSAMHASSTLSEFDGQSHDRLVAMFKSRDEQRIAFARHEVALAHHATTPQGHMSIGEIGVLQREIEKKRNHLPVRKLLKQAGTTIQAIKPVFMMSPISVAQFLEPGQLTFDLLLIDEASQVNPVDALGAIARARQIVVVGDDKQLPPTRFFDKMLADGDGNGDEQDDAFSASDVESILGFCTAQGMPQRMLRWHYRSRHESLIAVSNREFYNSRLFVVPSAVRSSEHQGLSFHHVTTGVFDRGGSATNRVEAQAVAQAAMQHARTAPEKSLGIGAFSVAQRDAIRDELELLRRQDPTCEAFFSPGQPDPFFIKNLENIQGDERDVIFISVGYGPDANGNLMMNFGPLQTDGGERRLNVLISRARDRCEVFSSITDDNIDLERARSRGAQAFKTFLHYARTGVLDIGISTDRGFDSEFEAEVARAVEGHGFKVVSQVGLAGFFIDLAVVDPECPGRYLLGIECDGATYHSSRSARDRDRLRESILRSRGWIIHRIWSTDWFHRPEDQLRKTLAAIEQAKTEWATRNGAVNNHSAVVHPSAPDDQIERIAIVPSHARESSLSIPYEQATFAAPQGAVAEMPPDEVRSLVLKVVQLEGPIHIDELTRRVVELTGGGRTGKRSIETVRNVLHTASQQRLVDAEQDFYCFPGAANPLVRDRSDVSQSLRKPEMLPPAEIRAGAIQIVAANSGASPSDVVTAVSRALGFASTSAQLRAVIEQQLESLVCTGVFTQREGKLYAVKQTASHVSCS